MGNNIVFNFFSDSKETAIVKISDYFHLSPLAVEKAFEYGCSVESFIDELKIDLSAFDSGNISLVGRHVTTSTEEELISFRKNGLLNLRSSLHEDTPLSNFLSKHKVKIDVDKKNFVYNGHSIPIEGKKDTDHMCFMGRDNVCSWSFGCDAFQKLSILDTKLYELGATLEFFVSGPLEEMLDYSTVSRCPEILDTIDQLISTMKSPYARCTYPLCYDWMSQHSTCYIVEFESLLANMDTFNPINYLDAYNEIKGCFIWSKITYDDYYERRVPQRVFDNRFLINRLIDVYIYGSSEQYGSLLPGLSIAPDALRIYRVENNQLTLT